MYSPKIPEHLVRRLYLFKHSSNKKKPMTKIVAEAIDEYLIRKGGVINEDADRRSDQVTNKSNCSSD